LFVDEKNWSRQAAWKKGEWQRTSSWAAKRRCSRPTERVIIALMDEMISHHGPNDIDQWRVNIPSDGW
jgi:hypothetical protein